jgi:hypothetical protein
MDEAEQKRRSTPVGLDGNGWVRHCIYDVRRGINWAVETSPHIHTEVLLREIQAALQERDEEIITYLVTEANAPMEEINAYRLSTVQSLRL